MADQQLKIDLTAKDKTAAAFRALNNRLAATRSAAMAVGGAIGKIGLAATAAGAGLIVATKRALTFADSIAKTADKVGISTAALQKYRFAADLAGVSNKQLDNAFMKLQKSIGDAATLGSGAALDALKQLGLESKLNSRALADTDVAFREVVKALESIEDQSQKASLAAALFGGKLGPELVNFLNQGIVKIDEVGDRLERTGGIIDDFALRSSEDAIDKITELTTLLDTRMKAALVSLAPDIAAFGKELIDNLPKIIQDVKDLAYWLGIISKTPIQKIEDEIKSLQQTLKERSDATEAFKGALQAKIDELKATRDALEKATRGYMLTPQPSDGKPATKPKTTTTGVASTKVLALQKTILQNQFRAAIIAERENELFGSSTAFKERQLKLEEAMYQLGLEKADFDSRQMKEFMKNLDREYEAKTLLEQKLQLEESRNKAAETQKKLQQQIADIMQDGLRTANEAISGLISGTMKWKDALGLVLKKVIDIVLQMGATKSGGFSFANLFSAFGSMFGNSAIAPQAGPMVGGHQTFHTGGMVNRKSGMGFRSDERMIVARTGERVLNRGQAMMAGADGGVTLNQTINLTTGIQQTVRAEVMSMAPQIAAQAKAAVLDAKRRGGGFSAAFA